MPHLTGSIWAGQGRAEVCRHITGSIWGRQGWAIAKIQKAIYFLNTNLLTLMVWRSTSPIWRVLM